MRHAGCVGRGSETERGRASEHAADDARAGRGRPHSFARWPERRRALVIGGAVAALFGGIAAALTASGSGSAASSVSIEYFSSASPGDGTVQYALDPATPEPMPTFVNTVEFGVLDGIRIGDDADTVTAVLPNTARSQVSLPNGSIGECAVADGGFAGDILEVLLVDDRVAAVLRRATGAKIAQGVSFSTYGMGSTAQLEWFTIVFDDVTVVHDGPGTSQPRWIVGYPDRASEQYARPVDEASPISVVGVFDIGYTMRDPHGASSPWSPCGSIADEAPAYS